MAGRSVRCLSVLDQPRALHPEVTSNRDLCGDVSQHFLHLFEGRDAFDSSCDLIWASFLHGFLQATDCST